MKITFDWDLYQVRRNLKANLVNLAEDGEDVDEEFEEIVCEAMESDDIYGVWLSMSEEAQGHLLEELKKDKVIGKIYSKAKKCEKEDQ